MKFLVLAALMACGASGSEVRQAQVATYAASPKRVLQAAMEAANDLYGVGGVDLEHFKFVTKSFFTSELGPRGWASEWARGGWTVEVHTTDSGHSVVVITPHAQRSLTSCKRCAPSWVDVPPDDVGLAQDLDLGRDRLALAIHERARGWEVKAP